MRKMYPNISLESLCGLFGLTRQAFYQHLYRGVDCTIEQEFVIKRVLEIRKDHHSEIYPSQVALQQSLILFQPHIVM
jgi:hypothetical protein